MAYSGSGGANNPMQLVTCPACGAAAGAVGACPACAVPLRQPFVAAFDIGQGSCNAIVGASGETLAFFDFGYSTTGARQPAPPTRPCLCGAPPIIVSHWDRDHYQLANSMPAALTHDWLGPQQTVLPIATQFMGRIRQAGGTLALWPFAGVGKVRHMVFPWGWVERGTQPQNDTNGSGLVAFVCVRDDPGGIAIPPRRVYTRTTSEPPRAAIARARQAARLVWGIAFARTMPPAQRPFVPDFAALLAAAFAASQSDVRKAVNPVRECAVAAVAAARVVRSIRGCTAARVRQQLRAERALPTLHAANAVWWAAAIAELAAASVAANAPRTVAAKSEAAAAQLTPDQHVLALNWPLIGAAALHPGRQPPGIVRRDDPPYTVHERFIVVNGDVDYDYAPSMLRRRPPAVVEMTAMHHGSAYDDNHALGGTRIPWARDARSARHAVSLADRFRVGGAGNAIAALATTAMTVSRRRVSTTRRQQIRVGVSRAARAAAAAVYAQELANPGELGADPAKFALVAAAAAAAAYRYHDPAIVGVSATLASTLERFAERTVSPHLARVIELVAFAVSRARAGAMPTHDQLREAAEGAIDGDLLAHVSTVVHEAVHNGSPRYTPDHAGADAATAHDLLWRYRTRYLNHTWRGPYVARTALVAADEHVINDLTTGAVASMLASARGSFRRHSLYRAAKSAGRAVKANMPNADVATIEAHLRVQTAQPYTIAWPPVGGGMALVHAIARAAAQLAAEKVASWYAGVPLATLRGVICTALVPADARIAARALRPKPHRPAGRVVYSYGVDPGNNTHEYESRIAGYAGHPHPVALRKYEARGWVDRHNTTTRSAHAGFQGDPDKRHPKGHTALAWDAVNDRTLAVRAIDHQCPRCRKRWRFHR